MRIRRLMAPGMAAGALLTLLVALGSSGEATLAQVQTQPPATTPSITIEDIVRIRYIDTPPIWSPDGLRLAYVTMEEGQSDLYVVEVSTGHTRRLTDSVETPRGIRWMSGGGSIIFTEGRRLLRLPLGGGNRPTSWRTSITLARSSGLLTVRASSIPREGRCFTAAWRMIRPTGSSRRPLR